MTSENNVSETKWDQCPRTWEYLRGFDKCLSGSVVVRILSSSAQGNIICFIDDCISEIDDSS